MTLNRLVWSGTFYVTSTFITMSTFLLTLWMDIMILLLELFGLVIYTFILPQLEIRQIHVEQNKNRFHEVFLQK